MNKPLSIAPDVLDRLKALQREERVPCLLALSLRFIFQDRPADLFVTFLGNHDEVKALLRSGRYR